MAIPDLTKVDAYAEHLSKVNEKNQVLATEDIRNDNGVLLVKKGSPISEKLASKMVKHKLVRPIEHSVNLSNVIDRGRLQKAFTVLLERYPDCRAVHANLKLDVLLRELCSVYDSYPLLQQKLTVLSMQRGHDFQKGLFCAWFSMALARKMGLADQQICEAFLAGLMHDTGMLHIDREVLDKKGHLSPEEWRMIQSHPVIGYEFLRHVPNLSATVAKATLEHHERRDGTGYPVGKFAEKLSVVGQIVAIADSVCAIRMLRLSDKGNLANLLPIIQFNGRSYDPECYRALHSLIKLAEIQPGRILADGEIAGEIKFMLGSHEKLSNCFEPISNVLNFLPEESEVKPVRSSVDLIQACWFAVASSGLLAPALVKWLHSQQQEPTSLAAIEEVQVMLKELKWQLVQIRKSLAMLNEQRQLLKPEAVPAIEQALEGLGAI